MTDIKKRMERLDRAISGDKEEKFRKQCKIYYNLNFISDEGLCECAKAICERRPVDPKVEEFLSTPIPPDAPSHLVKKAQESAWKSVYGPPPEMSIEQIRKIYEDTLEYEKRFTIGANSRQDRAEVS